MKAYTPYWRVYDTSEKMRKHIGMVEATGEDEALDKAVRGSWKSFWGVTQPTSRDNLVAVV